jgi:hypothetical protein
MRQAAGKIGLAAMMAVVFTGVVLLQWRLEQEKAAIPKLQSFMLLPQGEHLRVAVLGYHHVVADLLWLRAIQEMGERKITEEAGGWLASALDVITTLDPHFVSVYQVGGIALTTLVTMPHLSNKLLEKGMQYNPQVWQLPFLLGFNYYFDLYNDQKAAEYIGRAATLPGAPDYLARFAAKLYVSARTPQVALELLAQVYTKSTDENVKEVLEQRIKEVLVERDLQSLEEAIRQYKNMIGENPSRLEDLVRKKVLPKLPTEPFGGRYLYDPTTQQVRSSEMKERMKFFGHRAKQ